MASVGKLQRQVVGPFTLRHLLALAATLVVIGGLLLLLTTPIAAPSATPLPQPGSGFFRLGEPTAGLQLGQVAPELEGVVDGETVGLTDLDGRPIRLADLRGKPVWVNFWATWCPPCQEETPVLREVSERHGDDLALVAVSVQETTPEDVRRYAETYDLDYTIGFDASSAVFKAWQGFGLPTHYFLDADGVIRAVHYGPLTVDQAEATLAPLLG
jgi:thiol-disulfide isomerase/thioredoxin